MHIFADHNNPRELNIAMIKLLLVLNTYFFSSFSSVVPNLSNAATLEYSSLGRSDSSHEIISLLFHTYNFTAVRNCNVNITYSTPVKGSVSHPPRRVTATHRLRTTALAQSLSPESAYLTPMYSF